MFSNFSFPTKILFGAGAISKLPDCLKNLGVRKPLIVTDPGLLPTNAFKSLEKLSAGEWPVFFGVHPNPTVEDVEAANASFHSGQCDSVIGFGGGSALDVAKVIRLRIRRPERKLAGFDPNLDWKGLVPFVAIPTTAGTGSEVGRSSVLIIDKKKKVIFHPSLLADQVILDPELTVDLPAKITAATGADALTHCIESFTSPVFHPMCDGIALEALQLISLSMVRTVKHPKSVEARGRMQLAAMMGGIAFQKDLGAAHSLAHPLSSLCGLHHGLANALVLPLVMEFNAAEKPGLYRRVGFALGLHNPDDEETIQFVRWLLNEVGITPGLRLHGVKPSQIDALTEQAVEDSCHLTNPVPLKREDLRALYEAAL